MQDQNLTQFEIAAGNQGFVKPDSLRHSREYSGFVVTEKSKRPAAPDSNECFYCGSEIGGFHKADCVLVNKKIKLRMVVEFETNAPANWNKEDIEFHRNESSSCADNALDDIAEYAKQIGCLCGIASFEYLGDASGAFLEE